MTTLSLAPPSPAQLLGLDRGRHESGPVGQRGAGPCAANPAAAFVMELMRATYLPPSGGRSPIACDHNPRPTTCAPAPTRDQCGAPQGRGLTKNEDGSVTTAGGYKIVPEGKDAAWSIYDPQGKQLTRVWGDPHVNEADGTKWDFTKDSTFVLPDGTRIGVDTTAESGRSVTRGLDIANGGDRIQIGGIDQDKPTTGNSTRDGMRGWARDNGAERDTFRLRHDGANQDWVKYAGDGRRMGVVTGSEEKDGAYQQITNGVGSDLEQTRVRGGGRRGGTTPPATCAGPGGDTASPVTGGGTASPVTGGGTASPVTGGGTASPVTGGGTASPVTGGGTASPVTGGGTASPVTGGGTASPGTCAGPGGAPGTQQGQGDAAAFLGKLMELLGFGGLGQNGMTPERGYQALQALMHLMMFSMIASQLQNQQVDTNRYAGINGMCGR